MRKKTILIFGLFLVILVGASVGYRMLSRNFASPQPDTEQKVIKAPDFKVTNSQGETVSFSDFSGKPIVINFWATWCPPCKEELPAFDELSRKYKDKVMFMMVNMTDGVEETEDKAKKFVKSKGYEFPLFFDTELEAATVYGVRSVPFTVFIDAKGNIIKGRIGAMSHDELEQYVKQLTLENYTKI